jgi:hypothetical protein
MTMLGQTAVEAPTTIFMGIVSSVPIFNLKLQK